jgi:hypothetical protein
MKSIHSRIRISNKKNIWLSIDFELDMLL